METICSRFKVSQKGLSAIHSESTGKQQDSVSLDRIFSNTVDYKCHINPSVTCSFYGGSSLLKFVNCQSLACYPPSLKQQETVGSAAVSVKFSDIVIP